MTLDTDRVETVFVDSYSTLVDELSTERALREHTDNPEAIARIWDLRGSLYGLTSAVLDDFGPTWERYEASLDYALGVADADVTPAEREEILDSVGELEVYDDVKGALHTGMQGVRMNRAGTEWEDFLREPDFAVETFDEFADEMGV